MHRSQELDADHSRARSHGGVMADRLLHASCNRERGDGSRDDSRPALTGMAIPAPHSDRRDWCLLPW